MTNRLTEEEKSRALMTGFALYGVGAIALIFAAMRLGYL